MNLEINKNFNKVFRKIKIQNFKSFKVRSIKVFLSNMKM